ncbi:iron complex outermembrane recepter protein [Luteibacter sp. UNCMF331Sha3.1]|uniref:TonB-dependent receptor family protein n=1 Tax=Luteibacter sp. UNCMF331Sha3.1 TaxID=1502760 RepID=UPI0008B4C012|nr:TonB-dependent receptor [Luteibacter sp. UNCMF331Sha3.1]SEM44706.1 iron complex outermembrane recepter protein [Luteibacter sp. UNCMF331Sha3.1]
MHSFPLRPVAAAVLALLSTAVAAQQTPLAPVVVTATRSAQSPYDIPAAIDVATVPADGSLDVNLSERVQAIPGIVVRDRQNYAQDAQVSIRGFGARSTFGIRGIRLYTDGIPATMPDGQGQVSHFNLDAADRVEVLRGPFSALYGNASGGVVQIFTADGTEPPEVRFGVAGGSNGNLRASVNARGVDGPVDYNLDATHFRTSGYRDHSAARRESGNAKLGWKIDDDAKLTLVLNALDVPDAQDPLGLTRAQYRADPRQVAAVADTFDTRKSVDQRQAGLVYDQRVDEANSLRVMGYYGRRDVLQYLSIPVATQASQPGNSGGVVDLGSEYGGGDARWTWRDTVAGRPFEVAVGIAYDNQSQHRQGFNNFAGATLGVRGDKRRDEIDRVFDVDQYAQATWRVADDWTLMGGARHSDVRFRSSDRYVRAGNPDDSGSVAYVATTPVFGVLWRAAPWLHAYANWGRGFETPTFSELGYRADRGAGLAFDLKPSHSRNAEIGLKLHPSGRMQAGIALYRADSDDELAVATNLGGRTTYQNIASSRRQGVELSFEGEVAPNLRLVAAYTRMQASFRSPFLTCVSAGCAAPDTPVAAGTRIPGVPRSTGYAALKYGGDRAWQAGVDVSASGSTSVNDLGTASAPGYALFGVSGGYVFDEGPWRVNTFARVDNLADRHVIGSVIVNDGNARYYEPAPGRTYLVGMDIRWK